MTLVSIITATYNRSDVLRYAIESVRRQRVTSWEHIVVGDACTDDSESLVRGYADPRLRFVNRETNFGEQSGPNNDGLALARGEFVAYLNHDDLWFADHLERLIEAHAARNADIIHAPLLAIDARGAPRFGLTNAKQAYDPTFFVPASLWLMRRDLAQQLGGWRAARDIHASNPSQDFLVRAWRAKKRVLGAPTVTALILPSGGKPNAYVERDASQHAQLFAAMEMPSFRETLIARAANAAEREVHRLKQELAGRPAKRASAFDRIAMALRLHPDAVRNRLSGKKRGHWIAYLRAFRGLPRYPE